MLGGIFAEKKIGIVPEFGLARIDNENKKLVAWDETEVPYDLLVSIPTNMGDRAIERSGLGDELNFIPTDKQTLQSKAHPDIFVLGDATNLPTSKAGSAAHFQADILTENFLAAIDGKPMKASFDGHANCFIESGDGKGVLIDFNYDTEPLTGNYPLPEPRSAGIAQANEPQSLRQTDVPLGLLASFAARQRITNRFAHVYGGKGGLK